MTTYAERLAPYANFKNKHEMDEQVTLHLQHIGYKLNKTDHCVLNHLKTHAVRYPGVFQQLLETIAEAVDKSVPTVKRILTKLVKLGIIARKKTRKRNNSRAGATIYQFQFFVPSNEPMKVILCNSEKEDSNACESKVNETPNENKPCYSFNKSFKDTNITDMPNKSDLLKQGLLNKIPTVLAKAISPFMNSIDDIYNLVGTIFRAKGKVDKSIQIEQHAQLYHKAIVSVFESQKRAARKEKDFNVFGVMYKAIMDVTTAITTGEAYKVPVEEHDELELTAKQGGNFEVSPQWLIDQEQDPIKKARLIKQNEIAMQQRKSNRGKEALPSWFVPLSEQSKDEPKEKGELDIEAEHKRIMQALGIDA